MARTMAELPPGTRITDYISLGVIAKTFPLKGQGRGGRDWKDAPACASGICRRTWWCTT